jgi:hypothetical protein
LVFAAYFLERLRRKVIEIGYAKVQECKGLILLAAWLRRRLIECVPPPLRRHRGRELIRKHCQSKKLMYFEFSKQVWSIHMDRQAVFNFITKLLKSGSPDNAMEILVDDENLHEARRFVFWVDWREDDDAIAGCCEAVLQTGKLSSDWDGDDLYITCGTNRVRVPLLNHPADRHITLCSLNEALRRNLKSGTMRPLVVAILQLCCRYHRKPGQS